MAKRDYYEVLGVARDADQEAIKKAYRKKALKHHPDRNPGDAESERLFKEAAEAYEVLCESDRRARYDRYGHAGLEGAGIKGFSSFEDVFEAFGDIFGGGIFDAFFGGQSRGGRGRPTRGAHLRALLAVTLEEVAAGSEKTIELTRDEVCEECRGTGLRKGTEPESCGTCGGHGEVITSQGFFTLRTTCPQCRGQGQIIRNPCSACSGGGRVPRKKDVTVKIPPGVDTGVQLRLQGEGEPGTHGGPRGDLFCVIDVKPHRRFSRDGDDLLLDLPISFTQAALGDHVQIPGLDGDPIEVDVAPGTQPGSVVTAKGQGLPRLGRHGRGALRIRLNVDVPRSLSARQREILEEYAKEEPHPTEGRGSRRKGILGKLFGGVEDRA